MIIIIQTIVIAVALALLFIGLSSRKTHGAKAWGKLGLCVLVVGMVITVLFPNVTNRLAHLVGVGRGADLLLYVVTLAFIAYVLSNYLQRQDEKDALYRLARKVALLDAAERYNLRKRQ